MSTMGELTNKLALLTGAANGIGRAIAERFFEEGARLVLTDIDGNAVRKLAEDFERRGADVLACQHDVRDEAAWISTGEAVAKMGRLDILVNNAGIGPNKPLLETSLDDWEKVISANLTSVFLGCRYGAEAIRATPTCPRKQPGAIVNISSIFGLVGMAATAPYSASKGGVRLLTKAVALEAAENHWDVRVNSVHPGFTWTPMVQNAVVSLADQAGMDTQDVRQELSMQHPMGRMGEAAEIADAVLFLASNRAGFITGAELAVDGGYTAR